MKLTGPQIRTLCDALDDAFNLHTLTMMLQFRLNKELEDYALDGAKPYRLFELVMASQREGWTDRLIAAAREENPGNPRLAAIADELNFSPLRPASRGGTAPEREVLQRLVRNETTFPDILKWREKLGQLEAQVCRIEIYGTVVGWGTGFLVKPDMVLTNYHVMEKVIAGQIPVDRVRCRFDYKRGSDGMVNPGTEHRIEEIITSSPPSPEDFKVDGGLPADDQLDYALLRLARRAGELPIGENASPESPRRGWVPVPVAPSLPAANDILFVLQHPDAEPLKFAVGRVLAANGNGTRLRHDANTVSGSSGSPCFGADLSLVALHHAGDPNYDPAHRPEYNQAVPLSRIAARLKQQGVDVTA